MQETNQHISREPFAEPPVSAGFSDDVGGAIREVPGHPELLVRQQSLETVKDPVKGVELLSELRDDYGVAMPTVRPFVAEDRAPDNGNEDRRHLYLVCDRIDGVNLHDAIGDGQVSEEKLKGLYGSLLHYYGDKYRSAEPFLTDLTSKFSQFKYGTNVSHPDEQSRIYLVDTDPVYELRSDDYVDDPKLPQRLNDRLRAKADVLYRRALIQGLSDLGRLMDASEDMRSVDFADEREGLVGLLQEIGQENTGSLEVTQRVIGRIAANHHLQVE
jgi:hypothetical protein